MGDIFITDLSHFLDEKGEIALLAGPARKFAKYSTAIVSMMTQPEIVIP